MEVLRMRISGVDWSDCLMLMMMMMMMMMMMVMMVMVKKMKITDDNG